MFQRQTSQVTASQSLLYPGIRLLKFHQITK